MQGQLIFRINLAISLVFYPLSRKIPQPWPHNLAKKLGKDQVTESPEITIKESNAMSLMKHSHFQFKTHVISAKYILIRYNIIKQK